MMRLAEHVGRHKAHDVIEEIVKSSHAEGTEFIDALAADASIAAHLNRHELEELLAPESWLGEAVAATEKILDR